MKKRPKSVVPCALCGYHLGESGESPTAGATSPRSPGSAGTASAGTATPCPHCRREPQDESLRPPLRGPITGILAGTFAVPRGLYCLFSTPKVLRWIVPPLIVTSVLLFLGYEAQKAVGTSFLAIFVISISAVIAHNKLANVDYRVGVLLGIGGIVGAQIGARLVEHISTANFKRKLTPAGRGPEPERRADRTTAKECVDVR